MKKNNYMKSLKNNTKIKNTSNQTGGSNGNKQIYVIRKYIEASSALEAIKNENKVSVHDCYLEDTSQKAIIEKMYEKENKKIGF